MYEARSISSRNVGLTQANSSEGCHINILQCSVCSTAGRQHLCQINVSMWLTGHFWNSGSIMSIYVTLGDFFLSHSNYCVQKSFWKVLQFVSKSQKKLLCVCRDVRTQSFEGKLIITTMTSVFWIKTWKRHSHITLKEL